MTKSSPYMYRTALNIIFSLLVGGIALAQTVPPTSIVLVPVFGKARPGEFGSLWETTFIIRNNAMTAGYVIALPCELDHCPPGGEVPAQSSIQPRPLGVSYEGGALFYVEERVAASFSYALHTRDTSRQDTDAGVEIPVVRETDARQGTIVLPSVPLENRFRQRLRIYDIDAHDVVDIRVNFFTLDGTTPVASTTMSLVAPMPRSATNIYPIEPAFAQLADWPARFPQLNGLPAVRVEIEPLTPGLRYWAFVTITNNDSQHVTTISPQ